MEVLARVPRRLSKTNNNCVSLARARFFLKFDWCRCAAVLAGFPAPSCVFNFFHIAHHNTCRSKKLRREKVKTPLSDWWIGKHGSEILMPNMNPPRTLTGKQVEEMIFNCLHNKSYESSTTIFRIDETCRYYAKMEQRH